MPGSRSNTVVPGPARELDLVVVRHPLGRRRRLADDPLGARPSETFGRGVDGEGPAGRRRARTARRAPLRRRRRARTMSPSHQDSTQSVKRYSSPSGEPGKVASPPSAVVVHGCALADDAEAQRDPSPSRAAAACAITVDVPSPFDAELRVSARRAARRCRSPRSSTAAPTRCRRARAAASKRENGVTVIGVAVLVPDPVRRAPRGSSARGRPGPARVSPVGARDLDAAGLIGIDARRS